MLRFLIWRYRLQIVEMMELWWGYYHLNIYWLTFLEVKWEQTFRESCGLIVYFLEIPNDILTLESHSIFRFITQELSVEWSKSIECSDDVVHWYMWYQIINIKFLIWLPNQSNRLNLWCIGILMWLMHKCKISSKYQRVSSYYAGATCSSLGGSICCYSDTTGAGSSVSKAY